MRINQTYVLLSLFLAQFSFAQGNPPVKPPTAQFNAAATSQGASSQAASQDLMLTVPLSEASKLNAGTPPKPAQVPLIQNAEDKNFNAQSGGHAKTVKKEAKDIELVRTSELSGNKRALIRINGVSTFVDVGSNVLKYRVESIDKASICLTAAGKKEKGACSKTVRFEAD